jgi:hypothetical protein
MLRILNYNFPAELRECLLDPRRVRARLKHESARRTNETVTDGNLECPYSTLLNHFTARIQYGVAQ